MIVYDIFTDTLAGCTQEWKEAGYMLLIVATMIFVLSIWMSEMMEWSVCTQWTVVKLAIKRKTAPAGLVGLEDAVT